MSPRHSGFLRDIIESPDEDAPRLVYADWLDEHGDPARAEFIRAQCELEGLDEEDPRRAALSRRATDLLDSHRKEWQAEVPEWARRGCVFRRGFVEEVTASAAQWLRSAGPLVRATPLRRVGLRLASGRSQALFASGHLARVRELELGDAELSLADLRSLTTSPHLGALVSLFVFGRGWGAEEARLLTGWPGYARLRSLRVVGGALGDPGCRVIAECPGSAGLARLGLPSCSVGPDGYLAVATSPHLTRPGRLRELDLHNNSPGDGVAALLASPLARSVESLALGRNGLRGEVLRPPASWERLGDLWVRWNVLGDTGAAALAASPPPNLRRLFLESNGIGDTGALALAASPHLARLRTLALGDNPILTATDELRKRFGDRASLGSW